MSASRTRFDPSVNYYQVLNVPFGATPDEITRAYRGLIRHTHPDNFTEPEERFKAEERSKLINAAYSVLSKPAARDEYDRAVRQTIMSEALLQRYTGTTPGRTSPFTTPARVPSARTMRQQRSAFNSAVVQLLIVAAGVALCVIIIVLLGSLAREGWNSLT